MKVLRLAVCLQPRCVPKKWIAALTAVSVSRSTLVLTEMFQLSTNLLLQNTCKTNDIIILSCTCLVLISKCTKEGPYNKIVNMVNIIPAKNQQVTVVTVNMLALAFSSRELLA